MRAPQPNRSFESAGLSTSEARLRLERLGPNRLVARERAAWRKQIASLALDPMALMLMATAAIYLALGEVRDGAAMLIALVPVMGVDVFLHARSRSALAQLAARVAPRARVVRDGHETEVATWTLVPGDLLVLGEGDVVHADGVIRQATNLSIDEAALTGESEPQEKQACQATPAATAALAPVNGRFWAGAVVATGHGYGEITATGGATRYGEIGKLVAGVELAPSPLQRRTGRLVRQLAIAAVAVAGALAGLGLLRGQRPTQALLGAISLAMSAIPEEFPLVFTLFLSLGAWRLGRRGVLVRRLASVETLGSTTVICSDKTGTLTKGEFAVDAVVCLDPALPEAELLQAAVLACEKQPADAMEQAILAHARQRGVDPAQLLARWELVRDYDFDPIGKHMSHVWQVRGGSERRIVAKGAIEGVLHHCAISAAAREAAEAANRALATQGMRALAVAGRAAGAGASSLGVERDGDERDLLLYGLIGFRDPLRPEVRAAIGECQTAGVHVKLITGDHALTATAIAELAGIAPGPGGTVTGAELEALAPEAQVACIQGASVFARISPAQKFLIVEALRAAGEVVAMTGDGINDAAALRRADIGISMGARATEVARAAADIVLLDDNFASIVLAMREGRQIFRDIQRAFLYLLAFHVPIVGLALLAPLLGLPLLLAPIHLVWLELLVHPLSAFAFQSTHPSAELMRQPPRDPRAPLLPRAAMRRSLISGALLTAAVLAVYLVTLRRGVPQARGVALSALIIGCQLLVLAERVAIPGPAQMLLPRSVRFWVVWALAGVSLPLVLYVAPLADLFGMVPPPAAGWLTAVVAAGAAVGWRLARRRWNRSC